MENKNKKEATQDEAIKEEKKTTIAIDWAETASQELSDYIEEQGIQIRY